MVIFHSYVSLPEGKWFYPIPKIWMIFLAGGSCVVLTCFNPSQKNMRVIQTDHPLSMTEPERGPRPQLKNLVTSPGRTK